MVVETAEEKHAQWHVGYTAALVGFPPESIKTPGLERIETFSAFKGFQQGVYGEHSPCKSVKSYISWDYDLDGQYEDPITKGPGSEHPGSVQHCFADASVHIINKDVDPNLYFFLITRYGRDPNDYKKGDD